LEDYEMTANMTVGLPRGMLFHRYETLWRGFLQKLGVTVLVSQPTTQHVAEEGMARTIDEACLALKIFNGHVTDLVGKCDYMLLPRVTGYGRNQELCPRFAALYDITGNIFRDSGQKFLPLNIDFRENIGEEAAFVTLGQGLGFSAKAAKKAYSAAKKEEQKMWKSMVQAQNALYEQGGIKILIAAHSYVIADPYIGKPITDFLKRNGAVPIRADVVDREEALKRSVELSPTCKWQMNREIIGSIAMHKDKVDGIILLSTFPCGPDAMVSDLLLRRIQHKPMLNLVLDGQNGTAGVETRLESFLDIIRFQKGVL
jgi:predicted nucleotide-binding protein (sugar kinase/HSP70/actin superfamily)